MGTNYSLHLGKTVNVGGRVEFIAASKFSATAHMGTVTDEYGQEMSWTEFLELTGQLRVDPTQVGEWFS